jgi:SAM-dependent methyltransferase
MATTTVANEGQIQAWDGDEGAYWTEHEEHFERAGRVYNAPLFRAAAIARDEQVLDVGCGTGETTREAGRLASSGTAMGIDLSALMIERARERSRVEGLANVTFQKSDAQVHQFEPGAFDVAISRTGAMFFDDPVAAFSNIGSALRPKGRLALIGWRGPEDNEWIREWSGALAVGRELPMAPVGAPGPFGLADPESVRTRLIAAGFDGIELEAVDAPFYLGTDTDDAYELAAAFGFTRSMLDGLGQSQRAEALENLRTVMQAHDTGLGVIFRSGAWLVTARRA